MPVIKRSVPRIGIVGHEAAKFTPETEAKAREIIRNLIEKPCLVVSGHCHLGGIDIWAEEEAAFLQRRTLIFPPTSNDWVNGYKPRNEKIAAASDIVHCIVVSEYPSTYTGMKFDFCYHCHKDDHIKSGGCWTAKRCKQSKWWII